VHVLVRLDWHGLAAYVVVARDYIERNRRLSIYIYIYVQLQVVVQVSSADASVCCRHNCCCRYIYLLLQVQVASCCCRYNLAGPAAAADSTATGSAAANVVASSAAAGAQVLLQVLLLHAQVAGAGICITCAANNLAERETTNPPMPACRRCPPYLAAPARDACTQALVFVASVVLQSYRRCQMGIAWEGNRSPCCH
jgi:hypothetical protein